MIQPQIFILLVLKHIVDNWLEKIFGLCYYDDMKKRDFDKLLHKLSLQKGEEKLRLSSQLYQFTRQLRAIGELYGQRQSINKSRTTA
ncbi:MAG: hypothetical protein ACD_37C00503G0002 [uncultured bacterium]|nr:MAG: hypothetical protein ACD_37C00503G0002 [uncultured bacterium]